MCIVVEGLFPAPLNIVQCFINYFPHIVGRSNTITEKSLFVLALLMRSQHTFKQLSASPAAISAFKECLQNDNERIIIFSLKIIAMLLLNSNSSFAFITFVNIVVKRLSCESKVVQKLAICIFTIALKEESALTNAILETKLAAYLSKLLDGELAMDALRLLGMISQEASGAFFIEEQKLVSSITNKLTTAKNDEEKTMTMTFLASFLMQYSFSEPAVEAIPLFFEALENNFGGNYPLIFITIWLLIHKRERR